MQTSNGAQPHYVQGLEDNLARNLTVGGNFAFVIGKSNIDDEIDEEIAPTITEVSQQHEPMTTDRND